MQKKPYYQAFAEFKACQEVIKSCVMAGDMEGAKAWRQKMLNLVEQDKRGEFDYDVRPPMEATPLARYKEARDFAQGRV